MRSVAGLVGIVTDVKLGGPSLLRRLAAPQAASGAAASHVSPAAALALHMVPAPARSATARSATASSVLFAAGARKSV
jgi:hypothetical protein